jgi:hypothetical protein
MLIAPHAPIKTTERRCIEPTAEAESPQSICPPVK